MDLKAQRAAAFKAAQDIIDGAKGRDLTSDEQTTVEAKIGEVKDLDGKIAQAAKSADLMAQLGQLPAGQTQHVDSTGDKPAKSLGEHFVKHAGEQLKRFKGTSNLTVTAPEYVKAATDTQVTNATGVVFAPVLTEVDTTIVHGPRTVLTIENLLGSGQISGNAITYFIEGAVEGGFGMVAEGGAKPQLHIVDPTTRTDALKKVAGLLKFSDEMEEDLPYYVTEINNRGLYLLGLKKEDQYLNGSGTGNNILGILGRSGIQTETGASKADNADAVFRSMTKVQTGSGLLADGIVINPLDYQTFRLNKDGNGQYFGGGYFSGEYGNGGIVQQPPLWGLRTVVTPAIAAGTVLVGAFNQAATAYGKAGAGIRVESTNSHVDDFANNLITTRIEERRALAVRVPSAFVRLTLGTT